MKRFVLFISVLALVAIPVLAALKDQYISPFNFPQREGVERVTHYDPRVNVETIDTWVYLEPVYSFQDEIVGTGRGGYPPYFPRGVARLKSGVWNNGYPQGQIDLTTKDIPSSDRIKMIFEAWLVDDDSGYRLSIGTFRTVFGGSGALHYDVNNYLGPYDRVEVTMEPYYDLDVSPGPVVLVGQISKQKFFNPPPADKKLVTNIVDEIN